MGVGALLGRSVELLDHNGHVAIDATVFDRGHASHHYTRGSERECGRSKAMVLVDTVHSAGIDIQCSALLLRACQRIELRVSRPLYLYAASTLVQGDQADGD